MSVNHRIATVWCHICGSQQSATFDTNSSEFVCNNCSSSFVEELNQGVEEFISTPSSSGNTETNIERNSPETNTLGPTIQQHSSSSSSQAGSPDEVIQQILGRVLGMTASSITSSPDEPIAFLHQQNGSSRRPVGIVIRHSPTILATSSSLSGEIDIDGGGMSRGLFGLLNSISSIRQGSMLGNLHNPDALSNAQFEQFLHHILMNESSHSGAPPASENVIESLRKVTMEQGCNIASYGECCISQEPFEIGDVVVCLPCGHNYKEEPIVHWLKMHNTCPVCRVKIDTSSNPVSTSTTSTIS